MSSLKLFVLLFTFYGVIESKQFRFDYTFYSSIDGQLKFHIIPATWTDARLICDMEGGILASPSNDNMKRALDFVMEKATVPHGIYTGVNGMISKGYFYSIDGMALDDMPLQWQPGEPNNVDDDENCIAYENGRVADVKCTQLLPFMCYKKGKEIVKPNCDTIEPGSDSCYKLHLEAVTWLEAQRACLAEGGHLAVINSKQEAESIVKHLSSPNITEYLNLVYIGFHDWSKRFYWKTIHGQSLEEAGYAEWSSGYPTRGDGTYCGAILAKEGKLINHWCDDIRYAAPFLCETSLK